MRFLNNQDGTCIMTIDETLVLLEELNVEILQVMSENEQLEAKIDWKQKKLKDIKDDYSN